jgi:hypothetical protein
MKPLRIDPRSVEELLADAERYERWAMRTRWNEAISENFHRLAEDARARASRTVRP